LMESETDNVTFGNDIKSLIYCKFATPAMTWT